MNDLNISNEDINRELDKLIPHFPGYTIDQLMPMARVEAAATAIYGEWDLMRLFDDDMVARQEFVKNNRNYPLTARANIHLNLGEAH